MNERYRCGRCWSREAYVPNGLCLSCETISWVRQRREQILDSQMLEPYESRQEPVAVETAKPTNITNRKIRF